jgi:hypothetical protein
MKGNVDLRVMKYILRKTVLADVPEIEITEESYVGYKESRKILSNCLAIEEKYEILISNYIDLEEQMLNATTSYMVREHSDYSDFFDVRLALNIRLVNLLTSARLYVDQLWRHVRECAPGLADAESSVKSLFAAEYDRNSEYRFMEALRNYVQHRGIPVHWTSFGGKWTGLGADGLLEYSMELAAQKALLEEDGEFKKQVLAEIPDRIDLKAATRCYVESLSNVHSAVRELIQEPVQNARLRLEDAHNQYQKVCAGSLVGLAACRIDEKKLTETVPLMLDWDNIRVKLQKRNRKLGT